MLKNIIRVYGALGLAYFNLKKFNEAISALSKGLKANPRDLSSQYHLALCYYSIGDAEKARHEHMLRYGKVFTVGDSTLPEDDNFPGMAFGCKCGYQWVEDEPSDYDVRIEQDVD